ncbi:MAG TPA: alpha/beta fold hydrolase [Vicinamibacterales bacterium]|nr:alpha/beta fold hydrolase [Vicinamibacterales bacterium]
MELYKAAKPAAALVLAHGAGAGQKSAWMVKAASAIAAQGINCATFDFPYITAGRKVPDRAPVLEDAWRAVLAEARALFGDLPLFIGGKSMGGRIASHIAAQGVEGVRGLIFFGYPLHPPGRSEQRRDAHLPTIAEPMLFIQGSHDTFGNEAEMTALIPTLQRADLHVIRGGDHSFKVKGGAKAQPPAFEEVIATACRWMSGVG